MRLLIAAGVRAVVLGSPVAILTMGCSRGEESTQGGNLPAQGAEAPLPDASMILRGTVVSASAHELVLRSDSGVVTVKVAQPLRVYARVPSDLSQVKQSSFIGVTTVKQPDGAERATEIHVFPEELRGLGEGSHMMAPDTSASPSRMTNGTAAQSRMSNGSVSRADGSTLVVEYPGGSQRVTVPPNTPVTELKVSAKQLTAGDQVAVLAKKAPDGSLTADKVLSAAK